MLVWASQGCSRRTSLSWAGSPAGRQSTPATQFAMQRWILVIFVGEVAPPSNWSPWVSTLVSFVVPRQEHQSDGFPGASHRIPICEIPLTAQRDLPPTHRLGSMRRAKPFCGTQICKYMLMESASHGTDNQHNQHNQHKWNACLERLGVVSPFLL